MTSTPAKIHALCFLLAVLPAAVGAASRAPTVELDGAARALDLASESGASTYAPLELRFATEQLEQARQAAAGGDAKVARQLAERSAVNSDLALAKSRLGRVREATHAKAGEIARVRAQLGLPPVADPTP